MTFIFLSTTLRFKPRLIWIVLGHSSSSNLSLNAKQTRFYELLLKGARRLNYSSNVITLIGKISGSVCTGAGRGGGEESW